MAGEKNRQERIMPERVFVVGDAAEDVVAQRVLSRLGAVEVVNLDSDDDPLRAPSGAGAGEESSHISLGKRWLMLKRYRGKWLKGCPGTLGHVCCNLWVVNPGEGCPLDCTYCALQHYFRRNPTLKLFTNTGEMLKEIEQRTSAEPRRRFRICTGELTDSLVFDHLTDLSLELVPLFARLPNAVLEFKTKDCEVDNLLTLRHEHGGKTVVSWSVNAPEVVEQDEALTASLEQRMNAAALVAEAGYRVGLHFDPLVFYPGWKEGYCATIRYIFSRIDAENIAWISIAPLRYHPEQQEIMLRRFPESRLPLVENFLAKDNKLRIFQPLRFEMLRFIWKELHAVRAGMPVYMCMESPAAWRSIVGGPPLAGTELAEIFSRSACCRV